MGAHYLVYSSIGNGLVWVCMLSCADGRAARVPGALVEAGRTVARCNCGTLVRPATEQCFTHCERMVCVGLGAFNRQANACASSR